MPAIQRITPCLWFDHQAEDAANFYIGIFDNSRIVNVSHYGEAGREIHGRPPGSVMVVGFELDGQRFSALNGGPVFTFSPAISFVVICDTQDEIDYFWDKLSDGGDERARQCGWLQDKFGVSWQVVPRIVEELMSGEDSARAERTMTAILQMKKIDIEALERAAG